MEELINQVLTATIGVAIFGGVYILDLAVGVIKVLFTDGLTWSWKKAFGGFLKAVLWALSTISLVAVLNITNWYGELVGADLSFIGEASYPVLIGSIVGGIGYYLVSAFQNVIGFIKKDKVVEIDAEALAKGTEALGTGIQSFIGQMCATDDSGEAERIADEELIEVGQGATNSIDPLTRILPDGDIDNGKGWQCSKYAYFLATGIKMNYAPHPDFGPCNGNAMVDYLVSKCGYVYCGKEKGAIFSTMDGQYGHTGIVIDPNTNQINNANWNGSLKVSTNIYNTLDNAYTKFCKNPNVVRVEPKTEPTKPVEAPKPAPAPEKPKSVKYTYRAGDTFGQVILNLGLQTSHGLWGADGDVAYYTNQLHQQGIYGNIPVGATIELTKRG